MVTLNNEIEIVLVVWNIEGMDKRNDMCIYCWGQNALESNSRSTVSAWLVLLERIDLCPVVAESSKVVGCGENKSDLEHYFWIQCDGA